MLAGWGLVCVEMVAVGFRLGAAILPTEVIDVANILICDDAAFMRNSLRIMLEKGGHTVIGEAANGLEAVEQFKNMKPDLVTMDITMPEVDGLTALKMIRQLDPNAKVIMVSAMGQESMVKEAVLSGAKTFIVKPFKEAYILEVIAKTV